MRATLLGDFEKAQQRIGAPNETRLECKKRNKAQTSCLVQVLSEVCNSLNSNVNSAL